MTYIVFPSAGLPAPLEFVPPEPVGAETEAVIDAGPGGAVTDGAGADADPDCTSKLIWLVLPPPPPLLGNPLKDPATVTLFTGCPRLLHTVTKTGVSEGR